MADTSNLTTFLGDVANAIRTKKKTTSEIPAAEFDTEILSIEGGGDTSDATATKNDVLSPETFYAANEKQTGAILTTYRDESSSVENNVISSLNDICDYRVDIGYALRINAVDNTVEIYDITTNELVNVLNADGVMATTTTYTLKLVNAIFSRRPISGNIYNIYINGYINTGNTSHVGLITVIFDTSKLPGELEYFKRWDDNGASLGNRNYVTSVALTESNGYVFSGIQPESSYYLATPGNTTLYHIDNENRVITKNANVRIAIGQYGCVAKCTDDMRFIVLTNNTYNTIIAVSENYLSMNVLVEYTVSLEHPRCILTSDGVIYDYKLQTAQGIVHTYTEYPFTYNDLVLTLDKYLFVFSTYNYVDIYTYNNVSYEIVFLKRININGTIIKNYYNSTDVFTLSAFPIYQYYNIIYSTTNGVIYAFTSIGTKVLDTAVIKGNTMVNVSDINTTADKVLEGNVIVNFDGRLNGTMPNNGQLNYTSSIEEQVIPLGYTSGGTIAPVTANIDANIVPDNIKLGVTILGVEGEITPGAGDATSDANFQAKYLLEGYSMVKDGVLIAGTMKNYADITMPYIFEEQEIPSGYYDLLTVPVAEASSLNGYDECLTALINVMDGGVSE